MEWLLRIYLLAGLIGHKLLWEVLKRRRGGPTAAPAPPKPLRVRAVKAVKTAILLGILAQTLVPTDWMPFPIAAEPFWLRVTGVAIYTFGLLIAVLGRTQLGENWSDIETATVLREQQVVSRGVYGYIRHPIYVGDLLLLYGLELALNSWLVLGVVALTPIVLRQAIREEKMLEQQLRGYAEYRAATKRFIPFVA